MSSRVLFTLRSDKEDAFQGFVVISNHPQCRGVFCLSAQEAIAYTFNVEPFLNMKYCGGTRWEGVENGLTQFPALNPQTGKWVSLSDHFYVAGRLFIQGSQQQVGFSVMNLLGRVVNLSIEDTIRLGKSGGFVNAKIVDRGNGECRGI